MDAMDVLRLLVAEHNRWMAADLARLHAEHAALSAQVEPVRRVFPSLLPPVTMEEGRALMAMLTELRAMATGPPARYCACGRELPVGRTTHAGAHRGSRVRRGALETYEATEHKRSEYLARRPRRKAS